MDSSSLISNDLTLTFLPLVLFPISIIEKLLVMKIKIELLIKIPYSLNSNVLYLLII